MGGINKTHEITVNLRSNRTPYFGLTNDHYVLSKIRKDLKLYNEYLLTTGIFIYYFYSY